MMFEKIDIGIKTFIRDEQLFNTMADIKENCPGARMVIVDDGDQTEEKDGIYADLHRSGHITDVLPFDSGFGKKSNRMVELSTRPYLLIASDDFEFDRKAAEGIKKLQDILNHCPEVDIASGRVNDRFYEFFLDIKIDLTIDKPFYKVKEIPVHDRNTPWGHARAVASEYRNSLITPWFFDCDLTVNYSLIRREVFQKVRWDDDVKIGGGEHGAFFFDCKMKDIKTVCTQDANVNERKIRNTQRYKEFRNRANAPERPCFDKRNIVKYILGDGRVDYDREYR